MLHQQGVGPMKYVCLISAIFAFATVSANAEDRAIRPAPVAASGQAETLSVTIVTADGPLWSGTLTIGPQYGNAYFSQSKNEFAQPCKGKNAASDTPSNSNSSLTLNLSRQNWQTNPDSFNVNFSWTRALRACEGQGSDTFGFNRVIKLDRGSSVTIDGANGSKVTITRP